MDKGITKNIHGIGIKKIDKKVKKIEEKMVVKKTPKNPKNMALPKGVKSPVDYTKLYMSNELDGEVVSEKKMTKAQIKKRDEIADAISTREMNKRYGDKNVKYAIATKLAMKENTAIDNELTIQDWNVDEIKYTEIESVDIIKPEPLKPSPSNWREELGEDWQKVNKKDKTDGMSQKAVNAYRRENPGSKLKTAVTTKPSKLKKGSKASKRRKSFCARSNGQKKMHNIDCSKTPDKAICKARRRWNC